MRRGACRSVSECLSELVGSMSGARRSARQSLSGACRQLVGSLSGACRVALSGPVGVAVGACQSLSEPVGAVGACQSLSGPVEDVQMMSK